ncbi:MAG: hypothetical protein HYX44_04215, partial [Aquabacterium sp.]|nr:hypothetical protein [Aquabacterium sp.]
MTHRTHSIQSRHLRMAAYVVTAATGLLIGTRCAASQAQPPTPASTTQSWRCTGAAGTVIYSQRPCEGEGELRQMADERSASQLRQARDNQLRDAKLARQMQRERRHEERMASLERPISLSKNKPHVIKATPNDHRPKPVSDSTRPVKIRS